MDKVSYLYTGENFHLYFITNKKMIELLSYVLKASSASMTSGYVSNKGECEKKSIKQNVPSGKYNPQV